MNPRPAENFSGLGSASEIVPSLMLEVDLMLKQGQENRLGTNFSCPV